MSIKKNLTDFQNVWTSYGEACYAACVKVSSLKYKNHMRYIKQKTYKILKIVNFFIQLKYAEIYWIFCDGWNSSIPIMYKNLNRCNHFVDGLLPNKNKEINEKLMM